MTKIESPECKQDFKKNCTPNLALYYISETGVSHTGLTQFYGFGSFFIANNGFLHFMWGLKYARIKKHSVRMFQTSGGTCTVRMNQIVGVGTVPNNDIVIPSGIITVASVDDVDFTINNASHYNGRWIFSINPLGTGPITASDCYLVEVIKP